MNQFLQIVVSLILGFLYGLIFKFITKSMFITSIVTILLTIGYIYIMFYLNLGIVNYILKLSIILGFILSLKVSNLSKKV